MSISFVLPPYISHKLNHALFCLFIVREPGDIGTKPAEKVAASRQDVYAGKTAVFLLILVVLRPFVVKLPYKTTQSSIVFFLMKDQNQT